MVKSTSKTLSKLNVLVPKTNIVKTTVGNAIRDFKNRFTLQTFPICYEHTIIVSQTEWLQGLRCIKQNVFCFFPSYLQLGSWSSLRVQFMRYFFLFFFAYFIYISNLPVSTFALVLVDKIAKTPT